MYNTIYLNHRTAATYPRSMVCFEYAIANTYWKGDNNNIIIIMTIIILYYLWVGTIVV